VQSLAVTVWMNPRLLASGLCVVTSESDVHFHHDGGAFSYGGPRDDSGATLESCLPIDSAFWPVSIS